jgi:ankyrin repeat protein
VVNTKTDLTFLGSLLNSEGLNVIHYALKYGSKETIEYLCKHSSYFGIDMNSMDADGLTVLMRALIINRDTDLATRLMEYGADINRMNSSGETVLSLARSNYLHNIVMFVESLI